MSVGGASGDIADNDDDDDDNNDDDDFIISRLLIAYWTKRSILSIDGSTNRISLSQNGGQQNDIVSFEYYCSNVVPFRAIKNNHDAPTYLIYQAVPSVQLRTRIYGDNIIFIFDEARNEWTVWSRFCPNDDNSIYLYFKSIPGYQHTRFQSDATYRAYELHLSHQAVQTLVSHVPSKLAWRHRTEGMIVNNKKPRSSIVNLQSDCSASHLLRQSHQGFSLVFTLSPSHQSILISNILRFFLTSLTPSMENRRLVLVLSSQAQTIRVASKVKMSLPTTHGSRLLVLHDPVNHAFQVDWDATYLLTINEERDHILSFSFISYLKNRYIRKLQCTLYDWLVKFDIVVPPISRLKPIIEKPFLDWLGLDTSLFEVPGGRLQRKYRHRKSNQAAFLTAQSLKDKVQPCPLWLKLMQRNPHDIPSRKRLGLWKAWLMEAAQFGGGRNCDHTMRSKREEIERAILETNHYPKLWEVPDDLLKDCTAAIVLDQWYPYWMPVIRRAWSDYSVTLIMEDINIFDQAELALSMELLNPDHFIALGSYPPVKHGVQSLCTSDALRSWFPHHTTIMMSVSAKSDVPLGFSQLCLHLSRSIQIPDSRKSPMGQAYEHLLREECRLLGVSRRNGRVSISCVHSQISDQIIAQYQSAPCERAMPRSQYSRFLIIGPYFDPEKIAFHNDHVITYRDLLRLGVLSPRELYIAVDTFSEQEDFITVLVNILFIWKPSLLVGRGELSIIFLCQERLAIVTTLARLNTEDLPPAIRLVHHDSVLETLLKETNEGDESTPPNASTIDTPEEWETEHSADYNDIDDDDDDEHTYSDIYARL